MNEESGKKEEQKKEETEGENEEIGEGVKIWETIESDHSLSSTIPFPEYAKMVLVSEDPTHGLHVFDLKTSKTDPKVAITEFSTPEKLRSDVIKFKDRFLVVCSQKVKFLFMIDLSTSDGKTSKQNRKKSVSKQPDQKMFKINEIKVDLSPQRLLPMKQNKILVLDDHSNVHILDIDSKDPHKIQVTSKSNFSLGNFSIDPKSCRLIESVIHENCFYFTTKKENNPIILFNYEKNEMVMEFNEHNTLNEIAFLSSYVNSSNQEILVCGEASSVFFYSTSTNPEIEETSRRRRRRRRKKKKKNELIIHRLQFPFLKYISTVVCLRNTFLCFGTQEGHLYSLNLRKSGSEFKNFFKVESHQKISDQVTHFSLLLDKFETNNEETNEKEESYDIKIVSCSPKELKIVDLLFFRKESEFERLDQELQKKVTSYFTGFFRQKDLFQKVKSTSELEELCDEFVEKVKDYAKRLVEDFFKDNHLPFQYSLQEETIKKIKSFYEQKYVKHFRFFEVKEEKKYFIGRIKKQQEVSTSSQLQGFGLELSGKSFRFYRGFYYAPVYIGEFKNGKKHGRGRLFDALGTRGLLYEGSFQNDKKEGRGQEFHFDPKMKLEDITYEGMFKNDLRDGEGEEYDLEKKEYVRGTWSEGRMITKQTSFHCPILSHQSLQKHLKDSNLIAQGGNGVIYKVESSALPSLKHLISESDDFVAVKIMTVNVSNISMLYRLIKQVIGICSRLREDNPHVLEIYALIKGPTQIGYVMKCCKMSVDSAIALSSGGFLNLERKKEFLYQTAKGMCGLHSHRIMHRDLKWGNILLTYDNPPSVKLTDFDTLKEDQGHFRLLTQKHTTVVGTQGFMAPELIKGGKYGLSCDVFSFGIMIYTLLFEVNSPYSTQVQCDCGATMDDIFRSNTFEKHVTYHQFRPLLLDHEVKKHPKFLIDLMKLCWEDDPSRRPRFSEIVKIFENEEKKIKCYTIVRFKFPKFPHKRDQKMLLIEPKFEIVKEWVEKKNEGSKLVRLLQGEKEIKNDEDLVLLVQREETPVLNLEFDKYFEDEVLNSSNLMPGENSSDINRSSKLMFETEKSNKILKKQILRLREKNRRLGAKFGSVESYFMKKGEEKVRALKGEMGKEIMIMEKRISGAKKEKKKMVSEKKRWEREAEEALNVVFGFLFFFGIYVLIMLIFGVDLYQALRINKVLSFVRWILLGVFFWVTNTFFLMMYYVLLFLLFLVIIGLAVYWCLKSS